ncbi:hypothetical protein C8J56DRAFT_1039373 [Mycena floridula]|nr:hypothetical protein C8J56DRAFT_1039373 [Mycena floridula]
MIKWIRPIHSFEEDDWTESGLVWEIVQAPDSRGRLRSLLEIGRLALRSTERVDEFRIDVGIPYYLRTTWDEASGLLSQKTFGARRTARRSI